jgi:hypothetical protein
VGPGCITRMRPALFDDENPSAAIVRVRHIEGLDNPVVATGSERDANRYGGGTFRVEAGGARGGHETAMQTPRTVYGQRRSCSPPS